MLVYGPLAHGLLTGTMSEDTTFARDDWRASSAMFTGAVYRHNLAAVRALEKFAADRGISVSQLAIAWTLANPAVHVAIVGARRAEHVQDSLAAADLTLSTDDLAEIDNDHGRRRAGRRPVPGERVMTAESATAAGLRVAVLGTGTMGAPIARNLLRAGFEVRVWNRTPAKAQGLATAGAVVAPQPAAAAAGVDVLITMLTDGAAVEQVMTGPDGALSALGPDAVWIQMSTVGIDWTERLANLAAQHGVAFVDAPVSGSSQPAEDGQLVILASGAGPVRSRVEPIFDVLGRQTLWLKQVGDGSRLKLALNNWLAVLVEGMAETLTLSSAMGLDPHLFLATVAGGPLGLGVRNEQGHRHAGRRLRPRLPVAARRERCRARRGRRPPPAR